MLGKAAEGLVKGCGWHGMQGVRGSNPLSSTTTTPQVKGLPFLQPPPDCPIRTTRMPLGASGGVSVQSHCSLDQLIQCGRDGGVPAGHHVLVAQRGGRGGMPHPTRPRRSHPDLNFPHARLSSCNGTPPA